MLDCGILQKIDAIAEGRLPEELDELTALGRALFRVNALTAQTLAVVVAGGSAAFGRNIAVRMVCEGAWNRQRLLPQPPACSRENAARFTQF